MNQTFKFLDAKKNQVFGGGVKLAPLKILRAAECKEGAGLGALGQTENTESLLSVSKARVGPVLTKGNDGR